MKKQLFEEFFGSVVVMTAVLLIISIKDHDDLTLHTLLTLAGIVLVGSSALTLIRYLLLKKLQKNNNKDKQ